MKQAEHMTEFASLAVAEAIEKLQLVKPEAHTVLLNALPHFVDDPKYGLALRKTGTQLNSDEKAQLGIKPRSFMSKELLSQLTPDGLRDPTNSHELTMQRASLTLGRAISLYNAKLGAFPLMARRICPETAGCHQSTDWVDVEAFDPLPPGNCCDSIYRTCRSAFVFRRKGRDLMESNE